MSLRSRFSLGFPSRRFWTPILVASALPVLSIACVEEPSIPKLGDLGIEVTVTPSAFVLRTGEIDTITVTIINHVADQIRLIFPTTCPVREPLRSLIYSTSDRAIRDVFVDGEQVVKDGKVTTIDVEAAHAVLAEAQARGLAGASDRDYAKRTVDEMSPMVLPVAG